MLKIFPLGASNLGRAIFWILAILMIVVSGVAQSTNITVIVREGDGVPGGDGVFHALNEPDINDSGQVGFFGFLHSVSGGGRNNVGYFRADPSGLVAVVRSGTATPVNDGVFPGADDAGLWCNIDESGRLTFQSKVYRFSTGRPDRSGIFHGDPTNLLQLARSGQEIVGVGRLGDLLYTIYQVNDSNQVLFQASYTAESGSEHNGIFLGDGTSISAFATTDETLSSNAFSIVSLDPALNNRGQVCFVAGDWNDLSVLRRTRTGDSTTIARGGQPGFGGQIILSSFGFVSINNVGQVAFEAQIGTNEFEGDTALIVGDGMTLNLLVREGQALPGGGTIGDSPIYSRALSLNELGQVALLCDLETTNETITMRAILRAGTDGIVEVVRSDDPAPNGNGRFDFEETYISSPHLNNGGQIAFVSRLAGSTNGYGDNEGIFFFDDELGLLTVARKGDPFLGSTIVGVELSGEASQNASGFNNLGQIAFQFQLNDGRHGIAVWTPPLSGGSQPVMVQITRDLVQNAVVTSWPGTVTNFTLEATSTSTPFNWVPIVQTPELLDGRWRLSQPATSPYRLFRLSSP